MFGLEGGTVENSTTQRGDGGWVMSISSRLDVSPLRDSPLDQPSEFISTTPWGQGAAVPTGDGKTVVCRDSVTGLK